MADLPAALLELPAALRRGERALRRLDELTARVEEVVAELDQPAKDLAPGLTRLAGALDDPVIDGLPATIARLEREIVPAVANLRETQARVAAIAASTERITTFVDDAGTRIGSLPGLLLRRPFRGPDPAREYADEPSFGTPAVGPGGAGSADGDDDDSGAEM